MQLLALACAISLNPTAQQLFQPSMRQLANADATSLLLTALPPFQRLMQPFADAAVT
jgi:hypothetical protein